VQQAWSWRWLHCARALTSLSLAQLATALAAAMFVAAAFFRSANRQYLLLHPELSDGLYTTLLDMASGT
jgi:hypothetical protein